MRRHSTIARLAALLLLVATGCQPAQQRPAPDSPQFQSYELTDEPAYIQAENEHWSLIVARCGSNAETRAACSIDAVSRSLPDGASVSKLCAGDGGYIIESDCITRMALAFDLWRMARDPDPAGILSAMPRDSYPFALGRAANGLAKSIWQACPDGPAARQCRLTEAAARMGLSASVKSDCQTFDIERDVIRCLIGRRLAEIMREAARRLLPA